MSRRRGLVSESTRPSSNITVSRRVVSDDDSDSSLSDSSSDTDFEKPVDILENQGSEPIESEPAPKAEAVGDVGVKKGRRRGKPKEDADYTDELKWKKIRVQGSDKEVMVDVSRIQKYVDFDAAGVESFQQEIKAAKGNFREQVLADYSDL